MIYLSNRTQSNPSTSNSLRTRHNRTLAGLFALTLSFATSAQAIEPGWSIEGIEIDPTVATSQNLSWTEVNGADRFEGKIEKFFFGNLFNFNAKFADTAISPFPVTLGPRGANISGESSALSPEVQAVYVAWLNDNWQTLGKDGEWEIDASNRLILVTVVDTDGDEIPDDEDVCPDSIMGDTVVIGEIDSGIENTLFLDGDRRGCTLADLVQAASDVSEDHGAFVSTVAALANSLKKEGVISGKEKGKLVSAAARS